MKYNFDNFVDRDNTNSVKWNYAKQYVGEADVLPLWVADMDFETVPEVRDAIVKRAQHLIYGYTARSEGYYQAIIDWNQKRHGWKVDKKWITHSSGVVNALFTSVRAFTEPGDKVIIQPPVYHPFYKAIENGGRETILSPLKIVNDRYVPDIEDFERKIIENNVKLFILCNPHNPVGTVFTRDELKAVGELCLRHGVTVVSDEIHSDLVYKEYRHIPFASISEEFGQNSIICTAPSKTFNLAGLSTSNIIIPNEDLRKKYDSVCENDALKSYNIFGAVACEAAYRYGEEWLEQLLDYLKANRNYAIEYIEKEIPELKVNRPEGTYFLWVDFRKLNYSKTELENFLIHNAKIWLNQGYIFGTEGEGFARLNIACQRSTLEKALLRLKKSVELVAVTC